MTDPVRLTDVKNWAYCPRVVYYHRTMPDAGAPTHKMKAGIRAQEMVERLEVRRTLDRYGLGKARRIHGAWLRDEVLGLSGRVDLAVVDAEAGEGSVVDYKLTAGEPGENHRLQLHGYAMLVERTFGVTVRRTFLYRIPDDRVFEMEMDAERRERVVAAVRGIRAMVERQELPEPTEDRGKCEDCEFANFCGDIW